jgi:hypothetical protein
MSRLTVYRTHIDLIPASEEFPADLWSVELISHTEDGPQVEFVGEYFNRDDADAIAAAWRESSTRRLVWLSAALEQPVFQTQGETE